MYSHSQTTIARALSLAFLAGPFDVDGLVNRGAQLLGKRWRWLRPLARRLCAAFPGPPRPLEIALTHFLLDDEGFERACHTCELTLAQRLGNAPAMQPLPVAASWKVPQICTPPELAAWLGISVSELEWFADRRGLARKSAVGRLRHYHYRLLPKTSGQFRLVEAPKQRLKQLQRRILFDLLGHIPQHAAAHGFRNGRSIVSFAVPHVGRCVVLKMDLNNFFPSISGARVRGLFQTAGYPESVAAFLAGLCTTATPADIWEGTPADSSSRDACSQRRLYAQPHLPQGAPTSPALANLCAYRLDCRLAALARAASATYTRYADDLAFSGDRDFARCVKRFYIHACATAVEEGFAVHHRKTRIMRQGVRQRLAGIVVNERVNVRRDDFDRLKAALTNCSRYGPATQNRDAHADFRAHLLGRISFVAMVHPARGERLRALYRQIAWD